MLGLGDIVIPGIFISLCLKFDIDWFLGKNKPKSFADLKVPYHTASFIGYVVGMLSTYLAMFVFEHPQPALLFLVPTCTLSVVILAAVKGEIQ